MSQQHPLSPNEKTWYQEHLNALQNALSQSNDEDKKKALQEKIDLTKGNLKNNLPPPRNQKSSDISK